MNMKSRKKIFYWVFKIFIPNLILATYIISVLIYYEDIKLKTYILLICGMLIYFFTRLYYYYYKTGFFLWNNLKGISQVINEFKKGKFIFKESDIGEPIVSGLMKELITVGKQFDSIVSSQSDELKKFNEFYSHIICSINSYFMIIDKNDNLIYANEGFCKKFNLELDSITGKSLESLFYFLNTRLRIAINQVRDDVERDSIVIKNVHLMSVNRDSIIADLKLSGMVVNGEDQIVIIMDDITDRFSKDYHTSILSHLTETIGDETETDKLYYNILFGVTSGSGLGFNRAMLFLVEDDDLEGKIAVGPDSFEDAIEVWNSLSSTEIDLNAEYPVDIKPNKLLEKVQKFKIPLSAGNILTQSVKRMEKIHVVDASNDERMDKEMREFMEVNEFIVMPLISFNKSIGVIVADNKYNMTGITHQSIDLLSIFSFQAASLIESYMNLIEVKGEMKKLEERQDAIVESEKMAAVGRIASHIAHEIRNPLVTMGGYAKRIVKSVQQENSEKKILQSAEIILNESERLEKILSNVMDFTRPSKYIKEFNDLNHIIRDTYWLLKNVLSEKKIKLKLDLEKNLPNVKSDFNQMKQVILNLFQNSMDATPEGGRIEVITESDDENVIIRVRDTGTGINEDDPNVIFEPFFTTKITGVGLGLANVKKIIKDHKGKIYVANRDEGGVEFTIKIPLPVRENDDEN